MKYDDLHDTETRVTDATTGGQKGSKPTQVGALDPVALIELARVAGIGAAKYAPFNYLKGYDWSLSYNAMQRHANLFWAGEDIDTETGQHHMAMAAWHALALVSFSRRGLGTDTRPPRLEPVVTGVDQAAGFDKTVEVLIERKMEDILRSPLPCIGCIRMGMRKHRIDCPRWRP